MIVFIHDGFQKADPCERKTLPVLSFSRSFLASPHRACHERGERAQTRITTGEKQCGALVTVLVCFTQINRLTPSPHVLSSRSNEVVRLVVLRYDWPTMVLAFSNWPFSSSYMSLTRVEYCYTSTSA